MVAWAAICPARSSGDMGSRMRVASPLFVCLAVTSLAAAPAAAGCVGDSPVAADASTPVPEAGSVPDTSPPPADAAVPDTSPPPADAAIPDTSVPDTRSDAPPPFDPKLAGPLALWLDPATGVTEVGGKVSAWADTAVSAAAAITVSQPMAARQPSKGSVGGKPVIAFTPDQYLEASVGTKLDFGTGDVTAAVVFAMKNPGIALGGVVYKVDPLNAPPYNGLQLYGNLEAMGRAGGGLDGVTLLLTAPSGDVTDDKLHLVLFRRSGTSLSLRVDGVQVATGTAPVRSVDTAGVLSIGGRESGTHSAASKLGDVIVYKGTVPPAEVTGLETFLKAKNGIP